jgi:hypothetical protein
MTPSSPSAREYSIAAHEHILLGFSLRLHLLYRALLRASVRPVDESPTWTACAAEVVNEMHHDFVVRTSARLERAFAAMHGHELRGWEDHLAGLIRCGGTGEACSPDLLDEMKGIVESGRDLLPCLENGTAKETALMLKRYERGLARLGASQPDPTIDGRIHFTGSPALRLVLDWDHVLTAIWREQRGDFAPVREGSWRCLHTALEEVAETLPVLALKPFPPDLVAVPDPVRESSTRGGLVFSHGE